MVFGASRGFFESGWAQAQYRQIDILTVSRKLALPQNLWVKKVEEP